MDKAETDNTILETDDQASREFCLKQLKKAELKLKKNALLLELATEKLQKITLLLKTLSVWATALLPTDPEDTQLQTQILMRKASKKRRELAQQILAYQTSSAGLRAEIAELQKNV